MKKFALVLTGLALLAGAAAGITLRHHGAFPVEEKETVHKVLKFETPGKPGTLNLDNVWGSIKVEAAPGEDVDLSAVRTIRAESKEKAGQAASEVKLEITAQGGTIDVYVDGPFRCDCPDGGRGRKDRDLGYEAVYDFVLKVPRATRITLKTVTDGDILVKGVEGGFDVRNVNGKVELVDVAGSGEAGTVNGAVKADFVRAPGADCRFSTINGPVELGFPAGLSADFKLKTFHGEALSDFEVQSVPAKIEKRPAEERRGKFVYHGDRFTRVRTGKGGPVITCDTMNGDIIIRKTKAR
jgi:hypothetical protein